MDSSTPNTVTIGGLQWLDYAQAGPRKAISLVTEQKRRYLAPQGPAWSVYQPLLAGFRRAVNAPDPEAELDRVVGKAVAKRDWRAYAFREAVDGFLRLLPAGATGVKVAEASWAEADLRIALRHMIGLRLRNHDLYLVAPYCKEPTMDQETAEVLLLVMEALVKQILPGATPMVFDTRRGRRYRLYQRTNRHQLDAYVRGLAAAYLRQWRLAA